MMVGLQGSGKTTTTGKLTKFLKEQKGRKPLLVAADIYRPAAVQQLKVLGDRVGAPVYHAENQDPVTICKQATQKAFELGCDTILFDTAGRLTIDDELMDELVRIKAATTPDNILLVCDSMMGQDAVTTAKAFDDRLDLSGVVMTKLDGDARGGAALSIKEITGKPIKYLGMGEELDRIEEFRPQGLASRILGMGDVVGLMKDFERVVEDDAEEKALKMLQGQFTFSDFYEQIAMIQKMGSLKDIAAKLPLQGMLPDGANLDDKELVKVKAMIDSMTKEERIKPSVLNPSRVQRIARGSGRAVNDVNDLIKKFSQMRKMMGTLGKSMGMLGKIPGMGGMRQLGQMRQMAQAMRGSGGMDPLAAMMGGGMGAAPNSTKKKVDRDKVRKANKDKRKQKRKNRRK
jgi:signal recognition particle subunit SRP54